MIYGVVVLTKLRVHVPPAGALCILPMLIPGETVAGYLLQILAVAGLFMALFLLLFREKRSAASGTDRDAPTGMV